MKQIEKECEGLCPLCNSDNLEFDTSNIGIDYLTYPYTCKDCHNTGTEYFKITYEITLTEIKENEKLSSI